MKLVIWQTLMRFLESFTWLSFLSDLYYCGIIIDVLLSMTYTFQNKLKIKNKRSPDNTMLSGFCRISLGTVRRANPVSLLINVIFDEKRTS